MLFLTNPEGMTSPVIPLINFIIMGSSSTVSGAGGGEGNEHNPPLHPSPGRYLVFQLSLNLNKAITMDHDTFNSPEC